MSAHPDISVQVSLPIRLSPRKSFPMPYHEIGTCVAPDGRETRLGIGMTLTVVYFFIGNDRFSMSMVDFVNEVMPKLLELPSKDGAIVRESEVAS